MNNIMIKITNLKKIYKLYQKPIDRFKEALIPFCKNYHKEYYALDDINFEINRAETVGIIGRNGAGKSTLLKIMAGVLTPTEGRISINGRVASLLELGAGFNPELTGYENIYFNATLLGLTDDEINNKIQDILKFANIGDYINQPVKTYSNGMFVRLAFAVIAHVDADILIIDEALAVGDALFVNKCMSFIRKFMLHGTVIFVSHDNAAILDLCTRVIWLEDGKIKDIGNPKNVCDNYIHSMLQNSYGDQIELVKVTSNNRVDELMEENSINLSSKKETYDNKFLIIDNLRNSKSLKTGFAEIVSLNIFKVNNPDDRVFKAHEKVKLQIKANILKDLKNPIIGFILKDKLGRELFGENTYSLIKDREYEINAGNSLLAEFSFIIPMLQNGEYVIMASFATGNPYDHIQHHYVHEGIIINVLHDKIVFGLVDIPFENIILKKVINE